MNASVLDLRYKTRDILAALDNRETVILLYRGKPKGTIAPMPAPQHLHVCEHEFFGMRSRDGETVCRIVNRLRRGRHDF